MDTNTQNAFSESGNSPPTTGTGTLYRYPHPTEAGRFLYVGQGAKRDKHHRSGESSFGRRFKRDFPNVELLQPIKEEFGIIDQAHLNVMETCWMFQYKTWFKDGGYNLCMPGSSDYKNMGEIGGPIGGRTNTESGHIQTLGHKQGQANVRSGHLVRILRLPQTKIAQRVNGLKIGNDYKKRGVGVCGRTLEQLREQARKATATHKRNGTGLYNTKIKIMGGLAAGKLAVDTGRIQALGRKNSESGHLARISALPQTQAARVRNAQHAVESGQVRGMGLKYGRENGLHTASIPGHMQKASSVGNHVQWHVRGARNPKSKKWVFPKPNPRCALCSEQSLVIAFA